MRHRCWGGCGRNLTLPGLCPQCAYWAALVADQETESRDEPVEVTADADRQ